MDVQTIAALKDEELKATLLGELKIQQNTIFCNKKICVNVKIYLRHLVTFEHTELIIMCNSFL